MPYDQYRNIPNDFRRDYADLRLLMDSGVYVDDANGNPHFETSLSKSRAEAIEKRHTETPRNIIFVQIGDRRFQIEATDKGIVVTKIVGPGLDLHLSITPTSDNRIEIR